jgi:hypothetical protein
VPHSRFYPRWARNDPIRNHRASKVHQVDPREHPAGVSPKSPLNDEMGLIQHFLDRRSVPHSKRHAFLQLFVVQHIRNLLKEFTGLLQQSAYTTGHQVLRDTNKEKCSRTETVTSRVGVRIPH